MLNRSRAVEFGAWWWRGAAEQPTESTSWHNESIANRRTDRPERDRRKCVKRTGVRSVAATWNRAVKPRLQVGHVYDTRAIFDCACPGPTSGEGVLLRYNFNTVIDLPLLPSSVIIIIFCPLVYFISRGLEISKIKIIIIIIYYYWSYIVIFSHRFVPTTRTKNRELQNHATRY